jgi:hypothetical protein
MGNPIKAVSTVILLLLVISIAGHPLQPYVVLGQPWTLLTEHFEVPPNSVNPDNWTVTNPNAGIITVAGSLLAINTSGVAPPVCLQSKLTDILKPFRVEIRFKTEYEVNQTFFGLDTFKSAGSHRRTIGIFKNSTMPTWALQFYNGSLVVLDYSFTIGNYYVIVLDYDFDYLQITIDGTTLPRLRVKYYDLDSLTLGSSKDDVSKVVIDYVYVDSYAPVPDAQDTVELWPGTHPGWDYNLSMPESVVKMAYPKSAVLVDTTGDLLFKITIVNPRYGIRIYIPPEFGAFTVANVWTSATNDYNAISTSTLGSSDLIAPSWRLVTIEPIDNPVNKTRVRIPIPTLSSGSPNPFPYTFYLRIFGVKAPIIAGRYFFKIFMLHQSGSTVYTSIGSGKFPTLVVKGEVDPAYISGTILYGGSYYYGYYFGQPIEVPGRVVATGVTPDGRLVRGIMSLTTGVYTVKAFTTGYVQLDFPEVAVTANSTSDISFNLVKGGVIYTTINFKTENLLAPISLTNYTPIRIEVYDAANKFVGASIGYVPPGLDQVSWPAFNFTRIIGFNSYAGNPSSRNYGNWVNYYDTTDGVLLLDYGLPAGSYTIKAWVPGYLQPAVVTATIALSGEAWVVFDLHRMAHVYGTWPNSGVGWFNMFGEVYPLSWAEVKASGPVVAVTYTLDGDFDLWLPSGAYTITFDMPPYHVYSPETVTITVTSASESELATNLSETAIPIPEFPMAYTLTITAALSILILIRSLKVVRRRGRVN